MARKIGFYSIRYHARLMCKYITQFSPLIQRAYPENVLLQTLLVAAMTACGELVAEIEATESAGV